LHRIIERVRVEGLGNDATAWRRHASEPLEEATSSRSGAEHPEVLTEHDHRVEESERGIYGIDIEHASVTNAPVFGDRDGSSGGVDTDDVETAFLKVQADSTPAATHVQNSAADEPHRTPLVGVIPVFEWGEEIACIERHYEAVVAFDDLL